MRKALKISIAYAIAAGLYIVFSDALVNMLFENGKALTQIQTIKGWGFVFVTALLLFITISRSFKKLVRSEMAHKHSEKRLKLAMEAAKDGLWENNFGNRPDFYSDRMFTMLGYDPVPFQKAYEWFTDLLHPNDREHFHRIYNAVVDGSAGDNYLNEFRLRAKDGSWRSILSRGQCIERDENGAAVRLIGTHTDITELRKAQEALKESKEKLNLAIEGSGAGVWSIELGPEDPLDLDSLRDDIYLSPRQKSFIGFTDEEFPSSLSAWKERIPPEDLDRIKESIRAHKAGTKKVHSVEHRICHKDGSYRWISSLGGILRDENGRPVRWTGVDWDITERKLAEEKEKHLNRILRAMRNINQLIVREKNRDRIIHAACETLTQTLEYRSAWIALIEPTEAASLQDEITGGALRIIGSAEKNVGCTFTRFINTLEKGAFHSPCVERALRQEEVVITEEPLLTCTTCQICSERKESALTVRIAHSGKIYGLLSVTMIEPFIKDEEELSLLLETAADLGFAFHDIELDARNREANRAIQQAGEHLELITDNLPVIIAHVDADQRYVFANRLHEDLFPVGKAEIVGKTVRELLGEQYYSGIKQDIHDALRGKPRHHEGIVQDRNGRMRRLEVAYIPSPPVNGKCGGYFALGQDVTERYAAEQEKRKLQRQLLQSQKMEALGALARGIAHDFNNILASMIGFTELSLLRIPEEDQVNANLQQVLIAGQRAKELIQQILTFSRQSDQDLKPLRVDLVVKESVKLLRASLPATIEIRDYIAKDSGVILGDPTQIHQVIMNLCTNAGYAMRVKGGVLEISLSNAEYEPANRDESSAMNGRRYLKLSISDTGSGIPPEIRERIFEPYFTTKSKKDGTGLGLAVVHGIVKEHQGNIEVSSEAGKGAIFNVYLPLVASDLEQDRTDRAGAIPKGSEKILLVDDEPQLVKLLKQGLESLGYKVTALTSGVEALETFKVTPHSFDLVISDMTMPHMTGDELAFSIKKIRPEIPFVLCTGYSEKLNSVDASTDGVDTIMLKPVKWRELAQELRKLLDKKDA